MTRFVRNLRYDMRFFGPAQWAVLAMYAAVFFTPVPWAMAQGWR